MGASTQQDRSGSAVIVEGLLGRLLGRSTPPQPVGEDTQPMQIVALQTEGIPIGFTRFRASDVTGTRPAWYDLVHNTGDIDAPPIQIPMGPRHFRVPQGG